jgi:allantoin racemase
MTSKKILWILPSTNRRFINDVQKYLDSYVSPGYEAVVREIKYGGEASTCNYYTAVAVPYIVEEILKGEREGFSGAIIGCFGNPALNEARDVVRIPVVGPGAAACHIACLLGDTISIITTGARIQLKDLKLSEKYHHQFYKSIRREVQSMGLLGRVVSIRSYRSAVGETAAFTEEGPEATDIKAVLSQGREAIEEDGADVLVLGCAAMIGVAERLQEDLGVPVVEPALAALRVTEMLISMNLTQSTLSYPFKNVEAEKCPILYPPTLKGYHGYHK